MEATSTDNRKGITVVIPNYNGIRFLGDCLEALGRQEEGTPPYSILVVDNGSEAAWPCWQNPFQRWRWKPCRRTRASATR